MICKTVLHTAESRKLELVTQRRVGSENYGNLERVGPLLRRKKLRSRGESRELDKNATISARTTRVIRSAAVIKYFKMQELSRHSFHTGRIA
uniref:AlNc14C611G12243 protein n=1 Tax=Albugo laibachii Nc14 TaxID=890382 RepID=F0X1F9_9STRA|nr:AlNc14C611G12243 [Albugo laibachii Nc14]|eukprot:CCA27643.1 AlNc14C611G12243 [Albugo laibachii Nc14]